MPDRSLPKLTIIALALLLVLSFVAGTGIIGYATSIAPWAYSDSTTYLLTAKNLAAGKGLTIQDSQGIYAFLTWHPPLFPVLLSLPVALGADAVQSARWLNAIAFGLLCALAALATWRFSRSFILSTAAALLVLLSPDLLRVYSGAMSEGIFLLCGFLGLYLEAVFLQTTSSVRQLIFAGVLIGLSYLARYTGIAFLAAGFLALVLLQQGSKWKERLINLGIYALSAGLFPALWTLIVLIRTGTFGGRSAVTAPAILTGIQGYFREFWDTLTGWLPFINRGNHLIPAPVKLVLGIALLIAALIFLIWLVRRREKSDKLRGISIWSTVLAMFILSYLAFHIASALFADARPDVNWRLLSPVLVALYLLLPLLFAGYAVVVRPAWVVNLVFLVTAFITVWYFHGKTQDYLFSMHNFGEGYTSKRWQNHEVFAKIEQISGESVVLSNDSALVLFYTGIFPKQINLETLEADLDDLSDAEIALVIFKPQVIAQFGNVGEVWLEEYPASFKTLFSSQDADIYQLDDIDP